MEDSFIFQPYDRQKEKSELNGQAGLSDTKECVTFPHTPAEKLFPFAACRSKNPAILHP